MPVVSVTDGVVPDTVAALRAGAPVVLPLPSPLAYTVTATDATVVNTAKGRPAGQSVGLSVADLDVIAPFLDVAEEVLPLVRWLCEAELVSVLAPVRAGAPAWLEPAVSQGSVFFTATPWVPELGGVIAELTYVYMSSANVTATAPAVTAAQAAEAFGDGVLVLDGDRARDLSTPHGSTAMVRVTADGELSVARSGINNAAFGEDLAGYATDLSRRWRAGADRG
ncbi:Sua5/YciO/YrdC/YwlC family protein [Streptomyces sp. DW26H14]|uniref:Sua5/YciO/YrdC/YwlC family protein n=1 Tax=Streptomyces sp. DW26H14 TaxID=3435395 RepID=UPI00403DFF1E